MARTLEFLCISFSYDGDEPPKLPKLSQRKSSDEDAWGSSGKDGPFLSKLRRLPSKTGDNDRKLVMHMAIFKPSERTLELSC